jgi:hypothetical protein
MAGQGMADGGPAALGDRSVEADICSCIASWQLSGHAEGDDGRRDGERCHSALGKKHVTVGADRGFNARDFVEDLRRRRDCRGYRAGDSVGFVI